MKMAILQKVIYRFINISTEFLADLEETILNFIWKNEQTNKQTKNPRIAKTILNCKRTSGGNTIPELKLYNRAIVQK